MRASPEDTTEPCHMVSLWLHEVSRVFEDRLTCDDDHAWFRAQQERLLAEVFGTGWEAVVGADRLIYGDYVTLGAETKVRLMGLVSLWAVVAVRLHTQQVRAPTGTCTAREAAAFGPLLHSMSDHWRRGHLPFCLPDNAPTGLLACGRPAFPGEAV
jgi:hypothetical protein